VIDTHAMFAANSGNQPLFCRFNSGSPRCTDGRKSPRGPGLYSSCHEFVGPPGSVVEVTFSERAMLPTDVYSIADTRPWTD
jgi:hypothetical protein